MKGEDWSLLNSFDWDVVPEEDCLVGGGPVDVEVVRGFEVVEDVAYDFVVFEDIADGGGERVLVVEGLLVGVNEGSEPKQAKS